MQDDDRGARRSSSIALGDASRAHFDGAAGAARRRTASRSRSTRASCAASTTTTAPCSSGSPTGSARRARSPAAAATTACSSSSAASRRPRAASRSASSAWSCCCRTPGAGAGARAARVRRARRRGRRARSRGASAEMLRDAGHAVVVNAGGGSFKSQMKKADASGARYALIIGDDEAAAGTRQRQAAARAPASRSPCPSRESLHASRAAQPTISIRIKEDTMAVYDLEEQEQLDDLKAWWARWGNYVTVRRASPSASCIVGVQGWRWWQRKQAEEASVLYSAVSDAARAQATRRRRRTRWRSSPTSYAGTGYAPRAALLVAKLLFDSGDKAGAKAQLQWVIDRAGEDELKADRALPPRRGAARREAVRRALKTLDAKHDDAVRRRSTPTCAATSSPPRAASRRGARRLPDRAREARREVAVPQLCAGEARRARRRVGAPQPARRRPPRRRRAAPRAARRRRAGAAPRRPRRSDERVTPAHRALRARRRSPASRSLRCRLRDDLSRGCRRSRRRRSLAGCRQQQEARAAARARRRRVTPTVDWQVARRQGGARASRRRSRRRDLRGGGRRHARRASIRRPAARSGASARASTLSAGRRRRRDARRRRHRQGRRARVRRRRQAAVAGARSRARSSRRRRSPKASSSSGRATAASSALDAADGKTKWVYQRTQPAADRAQLSPAASSPAAACSSARPAASCSRSTSHTGTLGWEANVATPKGATELERIADVTSLPLVDERQVCAVAYQGRVACFDLAARHAASGRATCRASTGSPTDAQLPLRHRRQGRGACARQGDRRVGLEAGQARRSARIGGPQLVGDYVGVVDVEGYLHLLDRRPTAPTSGASPPTAAPPTVAAGRRSAARCLAIAPAARSFAVDAAR